MNKIKAYIRKLTQPRTKSAYQKSITYLLNIVEALMVSPKDQTPNKLSKRSLSEEKSEKINSIQVNHPKVDDREYSEDINSQSFKGSEISLVQKYKQKAHSPIMQRLDKKQDKINLRQFQQSIEIYYQCLYKSIQLIELLQQKVSKISNQSTNSLTKLRQFRQNYEIQRQNCQDFKSLINMSRQFVSKQFLTAIHQIRQPLLKGRYEKKQNRYLVVYE